ncbi:hypothetical protein [Methylosinus trichosporium]|uniref:hypothetical protein n=1 Tax=Methylosinus trichosporium TaxID=426 RepID=UPI0002DFDFEE|nr:hypothetical protein [Methylosinus trichosporium]
MISEASRRSSRSSAGASFEANPHAPSRFSAACAGEKLRRRRRASAKTAPYRVLRRKAR